MQSFFKNRILSFFIPFVLFFTVFSSTIRAAEADAGMCEVMYAICVVMGATVPACAWFYLMCIIFG